MNILIPMAGAGSRFQKAGYKNPKPLIDVCGKPMIRRVVDNLSFDGKHIFIVQKEHRGKFNLEEILSGVDSEIVEIDGITEGAACTTLCAKALIDNDEPLIIANSDQFVYWDPDAFIASLDGLDASMLTFTATESKWSFAEVGDDGLVKRVAEKDPISDVATVGVYWWRHGSDYVLFAEEMISKNIRVNNEFYVCPVFNEAIAAGKKVGVHSVSSMYGLGTPEDLEVFVEHYNNQD